MFKKYRFMQKILLPSLRLSALALIFVLASQLQAELSTVAAAQISKNWLGSLIPLITGAKADELREQIKADINVYKAYDSKDALEDHLWSLTPELVEKNLGEWANLFLANRKALSDERNRELAKRNTLINNDLHDKGKLKTLAEDALKEELYRYYKEQNPRSLPEN